METPCTTTGPESIDMREAVRRTVMARCEELIERGKDWERNETGPGDGLHFITREPHFGIACDVVEINLEDIEDENFATDWLRVYRPVVDPALMGAERSVDYWIEFGVRGITEDSPDASVEPRSGLHIEISNGADNVVDEGSTGSARTLSFPTPIDTSSKGLLYMVQGMIEKNSDNIRPRAGHAPPEEEFHF